MAGRSATSSTIRRTGGTGPRIAITQNDVRAIQLAKAALYAGVAAADGQAGGRCRRRDPPGRRVRQPDRPDPRDDPGPRPRLRPGQRPFRRQRGRDRCADRVAVGRGAAPRSRRRPHGREDRDRRRAALPGALRGGDGLPAQDRGVPEPGPRRRRCRSAGPTTRTRPVGGPPKPGTNDDAGAPLPPPAGRAADGRDPAGIDPVVGPPARPRASRRTRSTCRS